MDLKLNFLQKSFNFLFEAALFLKQQQSEKNAGQSGKTGNLVWFPPCINEDFGLSVF